MSDKLTRDLLQARPSSPEYCTRILVRVSDSRAGNGARSCSIPSRGSAPAQIRSVCLQTSGDLQALTVMKAENGADPKPSVWRDLTMGSKDELRLIRPSWSRRPNNTQQQAASLQFLMEDTAADGSAHSAERQRSSEPPEGCRSHARSITTGNQRGRQHPGAAPAETSSCLEKRFDLPIRDLLFFPRSSLCCGQNLNKSISCSLKAGMADLVPECTISFIDVVLKKNKEA